MKKAITIPLALVTAMILAGLTLLMTFGGASSASSEESGPGGGVTAKAPVPGWVRKLIEQHAGQCPQVTASLLAAQLYTESGFDPRAKSPVGALGIAQFMPATWTQYGKDGDGDGHKDILNPADAIAAQANYDCVLAKEVKHVSGDSTDNMLAAYNAGGGAVMKYGGVPPYSETRNYVKTIRELADKWADAVGPTLPAGKGAARAVAAAKTAEGTWYQWGGNCVAPFKGQNGCDCSSLVKMAWAAAGVNLPRVTYEQARFGKPVKSVSQLQPGDLIFSGPGSSGPEHVAMYLGNSSVIDAPHSGATVRRMGLNEWKPRIIAMRHIG